MKLTVNHKYRDMANDIMGWLFVNYNVTGNEEELKDEPLNNLVPQSDLYKLEEYLGSLYGFTIDLPKDLKFIIY